MVALFLSMISEPFDLTLVAEEGHAIEQAHALDAYATLDRYRACWRGPKTKTSIL